MLPGSTFVHPQRLFMVFIHAGASDPLLCNLSKLLLAVGASVLDGGPLLNAFDAEGMTAVDYSLFVNEFFHAYNALDGLFFLLEFRSGFFFLFEMVKVAAGHFSKRPLF